MLPHGVIGGIAVESNELNAEFWDSIKSRIKARNQENKLVESWVNPILYIETTGTLEVPRLILSVPSEFHRYYVVESLLDTIYSEIAELYRPLIQEYFSPGEVIDDTVYRISLAYEKLAGDLRIASSSNHANLKE